MKEAINKMKTDIENLSRLADDITLSEAQETELYHAYRKRIHAKKKKHSFAIRCYRIAAIPMIIAILVVGSYWLSPKGICVYASTGEKMVKLQLEQKVELQKQATPLGDGYMLELDVQGADRYYTIVDEENLNLGNIFRDGDKVFWFPDGIESENIRDEKGNIIEIPPTEKSILNIEVTDKDGNIRTKVVLILENRDGRCSVELNKLISYPVEDKQPREQKYTVEYNDEMKKRCVAEELEDETVTDKVSSNSNDSDISDLLYRDYKSGKKFFAGGEVTIEKSNLLNLVDEPKAIIVLYNGETLCEIDYTDSDITLETPKEGNYCFLAVNGDEEIIDITNIVNGITIFSVGDNILQLN